jgi:hypothetical protein
MDYRKIMDLLNLSMRHSTRLLWKKRFAPPWKQLFEVSAMMPF